LTEHLTDDELAMYAFDPAADPNRVLTESHLDVCTECVARLVAHEQFERDLADPDTWDVADGITDPSTSLQALRAIAAQDAAEDQEATRLLGPMLLAPAALVWANLATKRRYQTGGVVRLLTNTAQRSCEQEPLHALNYADLAIEVGRHLSEDRYSGNTLADLRGGAWKARANALRYLGEFNAALDALEQADREYRRLPHAGIGLAAVKYVRATVHRERDDFDLALREARESAEAFAHLGQTGRYIAARNVEGQILFATQRFAEARAVFQQVLAYGEDKADGAWIGRASLNLGNADLELGDHTVALEAFHRALTAFRALNLPTEAARAEWGIALVMLRHGRPSEGLRRLRAVRTVFRENNLTNDGALVTLDIIESLVASGNTAEIVPLAADLIETFLASGKVSGALTAVAYLKEVAATHRLTSAAINHVRVFLSRAERRPNLVFLPPPDSAL
jgi:tetratricopeptide (TPR) repeat protein